MAGTDLDSLRFLGGYPCLDFCNTIDERTRPRATDALADYGALARWAGMARLLTEAELHALRSRAQRKPLQAQAAFKRSLRLREALYRILCSVVAREAAGAIDLEVLNQVLRRGSASARVAQRGMRFVYLSDETETNLDHPLEQVARSAAELLQSSELGRVRKCLGRNCGWLFLDRSKNRSRRWCSMEGCGSRAKMRRLYRRRRHSMQGKRPKRPQPGRSAPTVRP